MEKILIGAVCAITGIPIAMWVVYLLARTVFRAYFRTLQDFSTDNKNKKERSQ
jgi:hypothetical protein